MSIIIPDGSGLTGTPQNIAEFTSSSKTGTKHQAIVLVDAAGNELKAQKTAANSLPVTVASDQSAIPISGGTLATTSGTITTSTSTVTTGDVGLYNNITVVISGTYAGVNATFEVSPDAGTTWVAIVGARLDGSATESTTGVLAANTTRGWEFTLPAVNRFRVRATAYTSGTGNVAIGAGTMPLEPVVNAIQSSPATRVERTLTTANSGGTTYAAQTGVTTEALINLSSNLGGTASNATTTFSPTAGKAYKITAINLQVIAGAAAIHFARIHLRGVSTGTATASSPVLATLTATNAVATSGVSGNAAIPVDIVIPTGWSIGVSHIETATTTTTWASIHGYEY